MLDRSALGFIETELVELPVIVVDGKAKLLTPEMKELDDKTLIQIAKMMGGTVGYVKLRASYSNLENALCLKRNCWSVARFADHKCADHTQLSPVQEVKL